jgi:hypothetical protein
LQITVDSLLLSFYVEFQRSIEIFLTPASYSRFVLVVGRMVNRVILEIGQINMETAGNIIYEVKDD